MGWSRTHIAQYAEWVAETKKDMRPHYFAIGRNTIAGAIKRIHEKGVKEAFIKDHKLLYKRALDPATVAHCLNVVYTRAGELGSDFPQYKYILAQLSGTKKPHRYYDPSIPSWQWRWLRDTAAAIEAGTFKPIPKRPRKTKAQLKRKQAVASLSVSRTKANSKKRLESAL